MCSHASGLSIVYVHITAIIDKGIIVCYVQRIYLNKSKALPPGIQLPFGVCLADLIRSKMN